MVKGEQLLKIIIIGLDGATWKLLGPWIKDRQLPFLASCIEKGSWGTTRSTIPPVTAPAWVTFQTGANSGKHGIFDFYKFRKDGKKEPVSSKDIALPPFWKILEDRGIKSIIINMPVTYPVVDGENVIVTSFLTPPGTNFAYPEKAENLLRKINYRVDIEFEKLGVLPDREFRKNEKTNIINELTYVAKKRKEAAEILAQEFDWDIIFVLFKSTDVIQHLSWKSTTTLNFYKKIDKLIFNLIKNIESKNQKSCNVIILSDHGFHKSPSIRFSLMRWLREHRFLQQEVKVSDSNLARFYKQLKKVGIDMARVTLLSMMKQKLREKEIDEMIKRVRVKSPMWASQYGIYLNKEGKRMKKRLILELKKIKYEGKKVFSNVFQSSEIFSGPFLQESPDIVFISNEDFFIETNPFYEKDMFTPSNIHMSGHHFSDPNGIFIAYGPDILGNKILNMNLSDFAPLLLNYYGIIPPPWMEVETDVNLFKKSKSKASEALKYPKGRSTIERLIDKEIRNLK